MCQTLAQSIDYSFALNLFALSSRFVLFDFSHLSVLIPTKNEKEETHRDRQKKTQRYIVYINIKDIRSIGFQCNENCLSIV